MLEMKVGDKNIVLCNLYAPTQDQGFRQEKQNAFLDTVRCKLTPYQDTDVSVVLGGDMNTYLDPALDKQHSQNVNIPKTEYACKVTEMCADFNLVDCWRIMNPNSKRYTWRQPNPLRQSRLDYWLISSCMFNAVLDSDIQPSYKSDHSLITLDMSCGLASPRGPGMWKFNVSLLRDTEYVLKFNDWLAEFKDTYNNIDNKALKWDLIKCDIRRETIYYCKHRAKERRQLLTSLSNSIMKLERNLANNPDEDTLQEYQVTKQELEHLVTQDAQGAAFRTKVDHMEFNENNSRYFAKLEKANYAKKYINELLVGDEQITEPTEILKEQANFYKTLYSSKAVD
jgi:hypothetical protein